MSEISQLIEGALALIRPDIHEILGAHCVLARPERHSVLLTEGAVLLLYYLSLLLQGGTTGIRKRVDDAVEKKNALSVAAAHAT